MKKLFILLLALLLILGLSACVANNAPTPSSPTGTQSAAPSPSTSAPQSPAATETLTIAAAASLTSSLNDIISAYKTAVPNVTITPTYGASGTLQTQIEQGAPIDIFFSAAKKQMDALEQESLIVTSTKTDLLRNEIVLIVPSNSTLNLTSFNDVASDTVTKVAVGDPKNVPAGQYAQDTFNYLKIWDKVSAKATLGTDVKQVLSWVDSANVDCGVVFKTDALMDAKVKIITPAPDGSHAPVIYPVAVVKTSTKQDAASAFIQYLKSDASMTIFKKYGFLAS